jgi:peptide/nickel transport system ATP-binding protein
MTDRSGDAPADRRDGASPNPDGGIAEPLLELKGVCATYDRVPHSRSRGLGGGGVRRPGEPVMAVRDASLAIQRGESVGVVGESGSGKTTLGNCAVGLMPLAAGEILYEGRPASVAGRRPAFPRVRGVQVVYQDPHSALNPRRRIGSLINEVLLVHRMVPRPKVAERCSELLDQVGLSSSIKSRRPRELSGGMCQRVAIARALAFEPRLLVADEIVSALDASVQAQVLNLLVELRAHTGIAIMLITHDLAVVNQDCDRVVVMHDGEIVETGATADVLRRPQHSYTISLLEAVPHIEKIA